MRQLMRGHALQTYIYDDETIQCITWLIIGYGRQYFRQYLMPSEFTGNRMEGKITSPTLTLVLLVNKLSMVMPIRVSCIPRKWIQRYKGYRPQGKRQGGDKVYGWLGKE